VVVRASGIIKLVRCLEVPSPAWEDVAAVLMPTFVFAEDNLGTRVDRLILCGFGPETDNAMRRFQAELEVEAEPLRSPFGMPGENNAGLLGYVRSLAKYN
jgi:type IV pilus assembly protein PilM